MPEREEEQKKSSVELYYHYEFLQKQKEWCQIEDMLDGSHHLMSHPKYLWLHASENKERCDERDQLQAKHRRASRKQRTQYVNYLKMIRNRLVSLITKGGFNIPESIEKIFEGVRDDVDGNQRGLECFFRMLIEDNISFGVAYCETNTRTLDIRSRQDELLQNSRPYFQRISPKDLKDWQLSPDGKFSSFRKEYKLVIPRASLKAEPQLYHFSDVFSVEDIILGEIPEPGEARDALTTKRVVTVETFISVDEDGNRINHHPFVTQNKNRDRTRDQIRNHHHWVLFDSHTLEQIEELPLSTTRLQESWLADSLAPALKIYNKQSDLDNILHSQCYDRIFIATNLSNAITADGNPVSDEAKKRRLSHDTAVVLPIESTVHKLDPTNPEALIKSIEHDFVDLLRVAFNQPRQINNDSRQVEGQDTRKEQKEDLYTRIGEKRVELLDMLNNAVLQFARFKDTGVTELEDKISFLEDVSEDDLKEFLTNIRMVDDRISRYPKLDKAIDMKLAQKLDLGDEEEIKEEIENTDIEQRKQELMDEQTSLLESSNKRGVPTRPPAKSNNAKRNGSDTKRIPRENKKRRKS